MKGALSQHNRGASRNDIKYNILVSDENGYSNSGVEFEEYTSVSSMYDRSGRKAVCVDRIIEKMPSSCTLLDAGCGTGNYLIPLMNSSKIASYTGLDSNDGMLREARKKAALLQSKGLRNINIVKGCLLERLDFDREVFDVVIVNQVLPHLVDMRVRDKFCHIDRLFHDILRVLKPGGVLAINTCSHTQLEAVWYNNSIPDACCLLLERTPDLEDIETLVESAGFDNFQLHKDREPLLGDNYWRYELCFTEVYRSGDPVWALSSPEERSIALTSMRYGFRKERHAFDCLVRRTVDRVGHTTQIFCRKKRFPKCRKRGVSVTSYESRETVV